jgi:pseudouridylate synthase / pseudouridine kinase
MPPLSRGLTRLRGVSSAEGRFSRVSCRYFGSRNDFFRVSEEVQDALQSGKPVVALETTIYTHGMDVELLSYTADSRPGFPYPENLALSSRLESLVRVNGGIPATIGIPEGVARVGMQAEELIELVSKAGKPDTMKVSRRDLGYICGLVML